MREKLTLEIQKTDDWFIGSCPEVPGANGQGRTLMSCSRDLVQAIALMLDEEDAPVVSSSTVEVEVFGKTSRYTVEFLTSWEGVSVGCPELPGCFSQGDDIQEAVDNIRDAIKDYLEVAEEIRHQQEHEVNAA